MVSREACQDPDNLSRLASSLAECLTPDQRMYIVQYNKYLFIIINLQICLVTQFIWVKKVIEFSHIDLFLHIFVHKNNRLCIGPQKDKNDYNKYL